MTNGPLPRPAGASSAAEYLAASSIPAISSGPDGIAAAVLTCSPATILDVSSGPDEAASRPGAASSKQADIEGACR